MNFLYTPKIQSYMRQKNKRNIVVEVISSSSSDFEVTELHVHFINEKQTAFFLENKKGGTSPLYLIAYKKHSHNALQKQKVLFLLQTQNRMSYCHCAVIYFSQNISYNQGVIG